jgi:hypothetical protein
MGVLVDRLIDVEPVGEIAAGGSAAEAEILRSAVGLVQWDLHSARFTAILA